MAQLHSVGRLFVVYGLSSTPRRGIVRAHVVEDTEWKPDENHRDGQSYQVHGGKWFVGVGVFNRPLSTELLNWIEEQAVWLDEVDPGEIAQWRGSRERGATQLGYGYRIRRPADEGAEADPIDVDPPAQAHGRGSVLSRLRIARCRRAPR